MEFILARARVIFLYLFIKLRIKTFTFSGDFGESCSSDVLNAICLQERPDLSAKLSMG